MTGAWRIAVRNLRRNRRRSLATGLAIGLGFAGLSLLGGYAYRVERFLRTNSVYIQRQGHLTIYKTGGLEKAASKPAAYSIPGPDQEKLLSILSKEERIELTARYLTGMGLLGNGCKTVPFVGLGVDPPSERRILEHPTVGRTAPTLGHPLRGRQLHEASDIDGAVTLSQGLAALLGKTRVHDDFGAGEAAPRVPDCSSLEAAKQLSADANVQLAALTHGGSISAVDGEVVSFFHTASTQTEDSALVAGLPLLQKLFETDAITYVAVFLKSDAGASDYARDLEGRLRAAGLDVEVLPFDDERANPYYVGTVRFLLSMVGFIVLLVSGVVALSVLNTMTLSVLERTREIGTLRALGFTRSQVRGLVVREAAALAVFSAIGGALLALAVAQGVVLADVHFSPPGVPGTVRLYITPTLTIFLALASGLLPLSVLAALVAARNRVRSRVADLLTSATA
jgi:putative ABC transport system permease protein